MYVATLKYLVGAIESTVLRQSSCIYGSRLLPCKQLFADRIPLTSYLPRRCIFRMTPKTEARYKFEDNIPNEYELIYRAPLLSYVKIAQSVSTISIVAFIAIGVYKVTQHNKFTFPVVAHIDSEVLGSFSSDPFAFLFLVSSFMLFNIAIYSISLRYPYRIYHNPAGNSYICVVAGLLPHQMKQICFKKGDIMRKETVMSTVLPWRDAIFRIGRKTVFIIENYFRTPADFNTMLRNL